MTNPRENRFGHIDLRVADLEAAVPFYNRVLPELGFVREFDGKRWKVFAAEGELPRAPFFAVNEEKGHRPNSNRIAFWAESRQEVDRLAAVVREAGAQIESGPRECPEYSPTYYAVFFQDPSGNPLEIYHRTN
jgi:catechol 2,3-dioxygenase-like lactoylglutathione lyase family enzyme